MDNKILFYNQFDDDTFFYFTFCIGFNTINITQRGEDKFDMIIDGRHFKDLIVQEKIQKKNIQQKIERENRVIEERKKKEQEYYNRALKYNGMDYYEGKERVLMNNYGLDNNNNNNKNKKPQYNYNYYTEHKKDKYNNNNNNNNKNYYTEDNKIINDSDIEQIKMNIKNSNKHINNQDMYNNNFNDNNDNEYNPFDDNNNPYPSFSTICRVQKKDGNNNYNNNNNRNNKNNYNNNYRNNNKNNYNNNYNNNNYNNNNNNNNKNYNNNKNNDLMNELSEVFAKEQNQNFNQNNYNNMNDNNDLPTYSQILNIQKKNSNENEGLINYIGNLNKNNPISSVQSCAPVPLNKVNINSNDNYNYKGNDLNPIKEEYDYGFGDNNNNNNQNNYMNNNVNNNMNNNNFGMPKMNDIDKGSSKRKIYVNNSSYKMPQNTENYDDDDENPYKDF